MGLAASVATYLAGVWLYLRVSARAIERLPAEWRRHPALREAYDAAVDLHVRSVFRSRNRAVLGWFAVFVALFAVLAADEFTLGLDLAFIAVLAVGWTAAEYQRNEASVEWVRREYGLSPPPRRRWERQRRVLGWATRFVIWVGYLGIACFVGGLIVAPFT